MEKDKIFFIAVCGTCFIFIGWLLAWKYIKNEKIEKDVYVEKNSYTVDTTNSPLGFLITKLSKTQRIPKIIHQTYFSKNLDVEYQESCMINKHMNPEYEYRFYTDQDVEKYISTYFPQYLYHYHLLKPGAYKADLFRYLVLYREGGVYMDCKSSTIIPLRDFIKTNIGFVSFRDRPVGAIQISFIASVPQHPLIEKSIKITINNISNKKYGISGLDITGPQVCGRALNQLLYKDELSPIIEGTDTTIDVDIIGSMKIIGENHYEVLCNMKGIPLVARTCGSYKGSSGKNYYSNMWAMGMVYN